MDSTDIKRFISLADERVTECENILDHITRKELRMGQPQINLRPLWEIRLKHAQAEVKELEQLLASFELEEAKSA